MRKSIITLSMLLLTTLSVFAEGDDSKKTNYVFPKFSQGWFLDGAVTGSVFQASDFSLRNFGPFHGPFVGASVKFGKLFSPALGLRIGYDYHPSKNHNEATIGYFSYKNLHADVMWNFIDGIDGYNPNRIYRPYLYFGAGLMGFDEKGSKIFFDSKSALEFGVNFGLVNSFKISKNLDIHVDLQSTITRWSYDEFNTPYSGRIHSDWEAMVGLIWYLGGRGFDACPTCEDADCSKQEAQIRDLQDEINDLRNRPAENNQPCDTIVKFVNVEGEGQLISTPFSIFFNKGSYELSSKKDLVNLKEIAESAKAGGYRIRLRGTCDNATGSKETNMKLAENRCRKVQQELVKLGVAEKDIVVDAAGGVSELTPAELDRRVFVELIK